jgi:hypothetical protein
MKILMRPVMRINCMTKQTGNRKHSDGSCKEYAITAKKIIVRHLTEAMIEQQKTKRALAQELQTSRSQVARLLDPENVTVSLESIARAAAVLGRPIVFLLKEVDFPSGFRSHTPKKSARSASAQMATLSQLEDIAS